jgi:hypothetical protein
MKGTIRTVLVGTGALVALYLALAHATDGGRLLSAGGNVYTGAVRTLQGR